MITINNDNISSDFKPYIIAEISANHNGSLERAKKLIFTAKRAGASAVKIQTYTPETMTINSTKSDFKITEGLWKGYTLYQLYKEAYTPYEWHFALFEYARKIGITLFSTPFDETAVDLLEELNTPAYKIASFELTDLPLIKYVAKKKKPMLISTGMATLDEISNVIECCKKENNNQLLLFHCVSNYPAKTEEYNLHNISLLANKFNLDVGLSDHSKSNIAAILATSLGASAIEKHLKLDNSEDGPDSRFSILPKQFSSLVRETTSSHKALGSRSFKRPNSEKVNLKFRRSIYFMKNLKKNHIITHDDIRRIRPGFGLEPKYFEKIIGKKLKFDVERGEGVDWKHF